MLVFRLLDTAWPVLGIGRRRPRSTFRAAEPIATLGGAHGRAFSPWKPQEPHDIFAGPSVVALLSSALIIAAARAISGSMRSVAEFCARFPLGLMCSFASITTITIHLIPSSCIVSGTRRHFPPTVYLRFLRHCSILIAVHRRPQLGRRKLGAALVLIGPSYPLLLYFSERVAMLRISSPGTYALL